MAKKVNRDAHGHDAQMFNLYLQQGQLSSLASLLRVCFIPSVVNGLDDEAKCRAHAMDVFMHDLLHDCRLACIVQSSSKASVLVVTTTVRRDVDSQHQYPHFLVLEPRFS